MSEIYLWSFNICYDSQQLKEIVCSFEEKRSTNRTPVADSDEPSKIITLPWIPGLSPKLRKTYRKHGYKAVFKSSANLKTILTSSNKSRLPKNSHPGVYMVSCKCEKRYVGETKLKVSTRIKQHERTIKDKKWDSSGVSFHAKTCKEGFDWENTSTLKIEDRRFDRKVREALEIQLRETFLYLFFFFQAEDGIRDCLLSRGLGMCIRDSSYVGPMMASAIRPNSGNIP